MDLSINAKHCLIKNSILYKNAEELMLKNGGKTFFEERIALRNVYCQLENPLTPDQQNGIFQRLSSLSKTVQEEAQARIGEWENKRRDNKIKITPSNSMTVEGFSDKFIQFYTDKGSLLDSQEHLNFAEVRKKTRDCFMKQYKKGVSPDQVKNILEKNGFEKNFIERATREWYWKANLK